MITCVEKTIRILEAISSGKSQPVSLSAISRKTGINKSTCSHIVSTLLEEGYLERISATKGYRLGPALFCLTIYGRYNGEFIETCRPILQWLHKKTGYAVGLATIQNGRTYVIKYINSSPKTLTNEGEIYPEDIYRTPAGRIILANMSDKELLEIYEKNGQPVRGYWDEVTSYETLKEQLKKIDGQGVLRVIDPPDKNNIIWGGYATAIFRYQKCVGAIVISLNDENGTLKSGVEREVELKKLLLKARAEIGRRLINEWANEGMQ